MRRLPRLLVAACALTGVAVGVGLLVTLGQDDEQASPAPAPTASASASPLTLADLDTTHLAVSRQAFCDRIGDAVVHDALDADPDSATSYVNGQRGALTPGVTDVSHEFDCSFTRGSGRGSTTARAWVFAPPVTPTQAVVLARDQRRERGCEPLPRAAAFGEPTAATLCHVGRRADVSYRGLFGDAWLACSLEGQGRTTDTLVASADAWCAGVAAAAAG